ncbi:pyruvate dehydrogenase [acetyl-transferring]-phosphatase 1, mitochondrial-like [Watersipora subatra]|uniref:pyruvate dehydrogenase [acetyl-transferring]-phosphatase 1, mitochondrial-like n=1 Tax=Watersipora subatra TaxID=2589382 RepID=UPI00355C8541
MALRRFIPLCCPKSNRTFFTSACRSSDLDSPPIQEFPRLSKHQVSAILQANEVSVEINHEAVLRFDNSRLAANSPIEDRHSEGYCNDTDGFLFGIFDGHAGVANAQAVSERLFSYIAINLLNPAQLESFCKKMSKGEEANLVRFLTHGNTYFNKELSTVYRDAIVKYGIELLSTIEEWEEHFNMEQALYSAFGRLDKDMEYEAFPHGHHRLNAELLANALSGCCAVAAHVDGPHLHVANSGDCFALLGTLKEDGCWEAKPLSVPHNVENNAEQHRLYEAHPNEKGTVIKDGRLLGTLAPTRAFGDFRFKLPASRLREVGKMLRSKIYTGEEFRALPNHYFDPPQYYYTPPYVTALPQVHYHHLRPIDKFLILATDGLWDKFPNNDAKVVQLVADHMVGAQTIADFQLPKDRKLELGELNDLLNIRKSNIAKRAEDSNCATHLIRNAIGQTELDISHGKLSAMLTLPGNVVRHFRDDITVTVVYFDETYLKRNLKVT